MTVFPPFHSQSQMPETRPPLNERPHGPHRWKNKHRHIILIYIPNTIEYLPTGSCPPYFSQLICGTGNPSAAHSSVRSLPSSAVNCSVDLSCWIRGTALWTARSNTQQCNSIFNNMVLVYFQTVRHLPLNYLFLAGLTRLTERREQLLTSLFDSAVEPRSCLHHFRRSS